MIRRLPTLKRLIGPLLLAAMLLGAASTKAKEVTVHISGGSERIHAFEQDDVVFVSLSELADLIGGRLDWETVGHTIAFSQDTVRMRFLIDAPYFSLNDTVYNLTFPVAFREGQLFVPAQTFIPYLDGVIPQKVTWDGSSLRVDSEYFNVTDMAVSAKANGLLIEIYLTSALSYDVFVTEGNWVNISIRDGKLNRNRILARRDRRYMYDLKAHQIPGAGQISLRLRRSAENLHHKLVLDPPRIQISVADRDFEIAAEDTYSGIGPDDKIDVIIIDPGHGGSHYGAVGPRGTREKDIALDIGRRLAKLIRKDKEFKVIMTRDRDKTVSLQERARIANAAGPDLFISIHANSSTKHYIRGWNVFYLAPARNDSARAVAQFENSAFLRDQASDDNDDSDSPSPEELMGDPVLSILNEMIMTEFQSESHDFAVMLDREFRRSLNTTARGVDMAGFFVLNMVFAPSVLVETGFISNKKDEDLLKSGKYQQAVAESIYQAIKRFKAKYEAAYSAESP